MNILNFELQGKNIKLGYLRSADKKLHRDKYWKKKINIGKKHFEEKNRWHLKILIKLLLELECITAYIAYLEGLHPEFVKIYFGSLCSKHQSQVSHCPLDQWFPTFLHQRTGKILKIVHGLATE